MIQAQYIHSDKCLYDGLEYESEPILCRHLISLGQNPKAVIGFYRGDVLSLTGSLTTLAKLDLAKGDAFEQEVTKWVPKSHRKDWTPEFQNWWKEVVRGNI